MIGKVSWGGLMLLCLLSNARGQTDPRSYTSEEGLSNNYVTSVVQDQYDFIWVGTHFGLNRFDGYNFKPFLSNPSDSNSLVAPHIETLAVDRDGNLWIGTLSGLDKFDPKTETFRHISEEFQFSGLKGAHIKTILEDDTGNFWIGTYGKGLFQLNPYTNTLKAFRHDPNYAFSISSDFVNCIYQQHAGELWIGTWEKGVNKLDIASGKFTRFQLLNGRHVDGGVTVNAITSGLDGSLLIGTWGSGICRLNEQQGSLDTYHLLPKNSPLLQKAAVTSICINRNGDYYITTFDRGIIIVHPKTNEWINFSNDTHEPYRLKTNMAWSVFEDRSGVIWTSTFGGGVLKLLPRDNTFMQVYPGSDDHASPFINTIFQASDKTIWIATGGKGLHYLDTTNHQLVDSKFYNGGKMKVKETVLTVKEDQRHNLWIGTDIGVNVYDRQRKSFTYLDPASLTHNNGRNDFAKLGIISIGFDASGHSWMGTFDGGVFRYDPSEKTCRHYVKNEGETGALSDNVVWSIFSDHTQTLWLGTRNFLNRYDAGFDRFVSYKPDPKDPHAISHNVISYLYEDDKGDLWIATLGGGVNRYRRETDDFERITTKEGLPHDHVYGIAQDKSGNYWFTTGRGIARYTPESGMITRYLQKDGKSENHYNISSIAATKGGALMFGGNNGLDIIRPESITDPSFYQRVVLTDFKLFNKSIHTQQRLDDGRQLLREPLNVMQALHLNYDDNVFTFEFAVLDYFAPDINTYAYKLEGFDKDWVHTDARRRFANYTNLSPGDYTLRIKATNHNGVWTRDTKSLRIIIHPPFWKTTWFILALIALVIVLVNVVVQLRLRTLKRQKDILKKLVHQQTEEIRSQNLELERTNTELSQKQREILAQQHEILSMHRKVIDADERKMRFFTNISHEFRTPLTLILGPLENVTRSAAQYPAIAEELAVINRNASRLLRLVNELMDFNKLDNGQMKVQLRSVDVHEFVRDIAGAFRELAHQKGIHFDMCIPDESHLALLDTHKTEIILYNLLSNAFKFTPDGGRVSAECNLSQENLEIIIRDSGAGIETSRLVTIFDRYYQIESNHQTGEGTGIGLAHAKELCELMDGAIKVDSILKVGSSFTVTIPLVPADVASQNRKYVLIGSVTPETVDQHPEFFEHHTIEELATLDQGSPSRPTILLIEDNAEMKKYISNCLADEYYVVSTFNAQHALSLAIQHNPHLIICDIMLPGLSGLSFCEEVKKDLAISHIPVVLLTARTDSESQLLAYENGADDFVTKPFNRDVLLARMKNLIHSRELLRERFRSQKIQLDPKEITVTSVDEKFLATALALVEANLDDSTFGALQLVKQMGMSRTLVHTKFKELTNSSTGEFIRVIRLKRACQLLREKKFRVSEVCYMVGFSDPHYFSKAFKMYFGYPPTHFSEVQ